MPGAPSDGTGWEYGDGKRPHIKPGLYDLLVLRWRRTRPFWTRDGIEYAVLVHDGPHELDHWSSGQSTEPPPGGYDSSKGRILSAHFNVEFVRGIIRFGPNSKLARAIRASYDGYPPALPEPECLLGRRVRGLVDTVVLNSSKRPLHWSNQYSTVSDFIGPWEGDIAETRPF